VPSVATAQAVISGQSTWHASAAYAFGFGRLSSGIINTQRTFSAIPKDQVTTLHLGASIPVGRGAVLLQTAMSTLSIDGGTDVNRTTTSVGYEYMHIGDRDKCNWLRERIETAKPRAYSKRFVKCHMLAG
jgi:hypothetical protein